MSASLQTVIEAAGHYGGLMLIHGTVLALVGALLSVTVFRHTRPAFRSALWVIVLIKFLVPPILPGELALSGGISKLSNSFSVGRVFQPQPQVSDDLSRTQSREPVNRPENPGGILLFSGYSILLLLLTFRSLWIWFRTGRHVRRLSAVDSELQADVKMLSRRIGIRGVPDVRWSEDDLSPYIFGFWRPVMVLPRALIKQLEPRERRALILHELAHVRRKDVLVRMLQGTARIVFFFFPPVLWVSRRIDHFAEMACDEWALSISGVEPDEYAGALIKVVRLINHRRQPRQPKMGIALVRDVRLLESRLRAVLSGVPNRGPRLSAPLKAVLIVWLLFGLFGGAQLKKPPRVEAAAISNDSSTRSIEVQTRPQARTARASLKRSQKEFDKPSSERVQILKQTDGEDETPSAMPPDSRETRQGPENTELTNYERGVLLARQFLQEKANSEKFQNNPRPQSTARERDFDSKRAIELRSQERLRNPF